MYFTSTRDGYLCIWAQRLDPETRRPVGDPLGYEHFHSSAQRDAEPFTSAALQTDLSVASDKMLINLIQWPAEIWLTQIQ
jgi:hypothetical protein